jgi:DNA polymerase-3 subunit gamma/tau
MDKFIVSARKYRPSTFNEVVGQSSITNTLKNAIRNNHVAQAFLFTGPRGVGKTTCARIFAKTINCMNLTPELEPCNECESCLSFNSSSSFNVHELDAASNNSVEDIRRLVEQVRIPPQVGKYKVYIIDEVHMLSQAAFNAFLKTLEEPPDYAKFILATTEKHKIIPTILSRCQIYDFNRITLGDIASHLRYVADKEGIEADDEALHIIAKKADGALRDALSIFDQMVSFSGKKITYEAAIENLNVLDEEYFFRLTDYVLRGEITESLLLYDEVISKGFEGHHFINGLAGHFRNLLVVKDPQTVKLLEVAEVTKKRLVDQSAFCSLKFLVKALEITSFADINYKIASDKRLFMELNLIKLCGLNGKISDKAAPPPAVEKKVEKAKVVQEKKETYKPAEAVKPPPAIKEEKEEKKTVEKPANDEKPAGAPKPKKTGAFGLSIKDDIKEEDDADKTKDAGKELNKSFDNVTNIIQKDKLKAAVLEYAESIRKEQPAFSVALDNDNISIEENNTVKLTFSNKSIDNNDQKFELLKYLREKFNEEKIQIITEIIEKEVVKKDKPMDEYMKLKKEYPSVEKIRTQLDLDF